MPMQLASFSSMQNFGAIKFGTSIDSSKQYWRIGGDNKGNEYYWHLALVLYLLLFNFCTSSGPDGIS
jgi:hypothetical protein